MCEDAKHGNENPKLGKARSIRAHRNGMAGDHKGVIPAIHAQACKNSVRRLLPLCPCHKPRRASRLPSSDARSTQFSSANPGIWSRPPGSVRGHAPPLNFDSRYPEPCHFWILCESRLAASWFPPIRCHSFKHDDSSTVIVPSRSPLHHTLFVVCLVI